MLMRVTVHNRGPDAAALHLLPQLWFRNTWSWSDGRAKPALARRAAPAIVAVAAPRAGHVSAATAEGEPELLFCENETNAARLFGVPTAPGYFKDAFHDYVVERRRDGRQSRAAAAPRRRRITRSNVPAGRSTSACACG